MNRLAGEPSPYLRQHRENPVDWYPWGPDALGAATSRDRPILLSVGYSSCHWCHVMAHESFEDPETAAYMNAHFVNIKVDREERPDVDALYMEAVQALSGRGGWPMTVFLTPSGEPFFGGTYFPPTARGGLPSFRELMEAVTDAWDTRRDDVATQATNLTDAIARTSELARDTDGGPGAGFEPAAAIDALRTWMVQAWDPGWGGFGHAPKFPQASAIEMALRWASEDPHDDEALAIATTTLAGMAAGGIYDHLGGGFARYSTDERWLVPHFEKMLYDQAALVRAYLHGWQLTGESGWLQIVDETIDYAMRDLARPDGGLASAEDADSEGEEGLFYLWRAKEVTDLLPEDLAEAFMDFYGVTWKGNTGNGDTILHRPPGIPVPRPPEVAEARRILAAERAKRTRPGLDTKVLTEWNALFLSALAEAASATGNPKWRDHAVLLGEFLLSALRRPGDGRWMRSFQEGAARHLAFATDYAWIVEAMTRLGELTGQARWTRAACEAADGLLELFWVHDGGGFSTSGSDGEALVVAHRDLFDGSTPSAQAAAAGALWRLGALTGNDAYTEAAQVTLELLAPRMISQPAACAHAIGVADLIRRGPVEVVVTGRRPDLVEAAQAAFAPALVLAWGEPYPSPLWEGRDSEGELEGLAYVCRDYTCSAPTGVAGELLRILNAPTR